MTNIEKAKEAVQGSSLTKREPLESLIKKEDVVKRFKEVLKDKAPGFLASVLSAYNSNPQLKVCDPVTILSSSMIAATLDLPINSNLGFAHIVPYSGRAQFQMGWKGFVQLAIRTGQYKTMNASEVYDGELVSYNRITGEVLIDPNGKKSDTVIGYVSFFKLVNGFEKYLYMTTEQVRKHGQTYSKSFSSPNGRWQVDFDSMAKKTVVKMLLGKWGILSVDLRRAIVADQSSPNDLDTAEAIDVEGEVVYPDNPEQSLETDLNAKEGQSQEPVKKTALDIKINQLKDELSKKFPEKDGKHTKGEVIFFNELGNLGATDISELSDLNKEVLLGLLRDKLKK